MIYVILARAVNEMKIGVSNQPDERMKALQTAYSYPLKIAYVIPKASFKEEKRFHLELRHFRRHGEWFEMTPESLQLLDGLLSKYKFFNGVQWTAHAFVRKGYRHVRLLRSPGLHDTIVRVKPRSRDEQIAWLKARIAEEKAGS